MCLRESHLVLIPLGVNNLVSRRRPSRNRDPLYYGISLCIVLKLFLECIIEFGDKDLILFLLEHSANVNKHILFPEDEDIKLDAVTGKKTLEGATSRIRRGILFF